MMINMLLIDKKRQHQFHLSYVCSSKIIIYDIIGQKFNITMHGNFDTPTMNNVKNSIENYNIRILCLIIFYNDTYGIKN